MGSYTFQPASQGHCAEGHGQPALCPRHGLGFRYDFASLPWQPQAQACGHVFFWLGSCSWSCLSPPLLSVMSQTGHQWDPQQPGGPRGTGGQASCWLVWAQGRPGGQPDPGPQAGHGALVEPAWPQVAGGLPDRQPGSSQPYLMPLRGGRPSPPHVLPASTRAQGAGWGAGPQQRAFEGTASPESCPRQPGASSLTGRRGPGVGAGLGVKAGSPPPPWRGCPRSSCASLPNP